MAQRSRKRGRRQRPDAGPRGGAAPGAQTRAVATRATTGIGPEPRPSRSEQRNAAVRASLTPLAPGERPWPVTVGAAVALLLGAANLIAYLAGVKIGGKVPAASGIVVFAGLMLACSIGMWRMWYGAVLGFMALLAIIVALFTLLLIKASNLLGFLVAPAIIAGAGFLFWKLVRVLSRIQMPRPPTGERG